MPPGLHLVLGDHAAATFNSVFGARDRLLIDRDVLCCGPTPAGLDLAAWSKTRHDFWQSTVPGALDERASSPQDLLANLDALRGAGKITLWTSTSLSEQLFIAHVIHRADAAGVDPTRLQLVRFEKSLGTGEVTEQQWAQHPEPVPLPPREPQDHRDAWAALTSPDPTLIERFNDSHPQANPWLQRAMQLLMRRFPERHTGLPWWDFTLLSESSSHGPKAARIIGQALVDYWDEGDLVGDWYLFGRLLRLGDPRLPRPLLDITGDRSSMRDCQASLTPFGREVLECRIANYPTNPIDDWASGVRLSSADHQLWLREDGKLVRQSS